MSEQPSTRTREPADDAPRRPRRSLREAQREFTRQHLLDAAHEIFLEKGYAATSIEDVASAAGTTRATFYMHFRSKCDLVKALMAETGEAGYALWTPLGELAAEPRREAVRAWLESTIAWWTDARQEITIFLQASAIEPELIADQAAADRRNLERVVELVPRFQREDGRVEAMLLVAQLERFFYFWIVRGWEMDREQVVAILTETWWRALNG